MTLNIFTFGDLTFKQLNRNAMGTPPAPPYATIYYGIHEEKFLPHHSRRVIYYRRFIDDVIGIWGPNKDPQLDESDWNDFKQKMNSFPGLTLNNSNMIDTTLFKKRLNLHLYIPPHSAHPPGLLLGIVYSTLFRIFTLCSCETDKLQ